MNLFRSTVSALRKGLSRTREVMTTDIRTLLRGQRLTDEMIDQLERLLITADVGVKTTASVIDHLRTAYREGRVQRGEEAIDLLKAQLKSHWAAIDRSLAVAPNSPTVILVVGVNGAGKTTSVAKIAKSLRDQGRSVLLAATDTFRAGAVAQLEVWAKRLDVDIVKGRSGADPASVAFDATEAAISRGVDVLLIDTAGRLHTQENLMRELAKIRDVVSRKIPGAPHEVLLVLDATSGQNAIAQASIFKKAINVTGIFLAKLDGTAKGGIVIAIRDALNVPVKLIGVGERPEDVEAFDPQEFIDAMFAT